MQKGHSRPIALQSTRGVEHGSSLPVQHLGEAEKFEQEANLYCTKQHWVINNSWRGLSGTSCLKY